MQPQEPTTGVLEDPPTPDVYDLQQRDIPLHTLPVKHEGPVTVWRLPSRRSSAIATVLGTSFDKILPADDKRARATLVCSVAWEYSRTGATGSGLPIPANVPITIEHCDRVDARVPTSTGTLSVIAEYWAD